MLPSVGNFKPSSLDTRNMSLKSKLLLLGTFLCSLHLDQVLSEFHFPPPIEKCHINDEQCMIDQGNKFLRANPHGSKELGLADMEPFVLKELNILGDEKSPANINLYMTDMKFYNYSTIILTKMQGFVKDPKKPMKIIVDAVVPKMTMKSKYKINGKVLLLPITGDGDMEWVITDIDVKTKMLMTPEVRDGKTWLNLTEYDLKTEYKNVKIDMTNLFNGDKALSTSMLEIVNDNWRELSTDARPQVESAMKKTNREFIAKLLEKIPYADFFLMDD